MFFYRIQGGWREVAELVRFEDFVGQVHYLYQSGSMVVVLNSAFVYRAAPRRERYFAFRVLLHLRGKHMAPKSHVRSRQRGREHYIGLFQLAD